VKLHNEIFSIVNIIFSNDSKLFSLGDNVIISNNYFN